jgi:hypothetical protein
VGVGVRKADTASDKIFFDAARGGLSGDITLVESIIVHLPAASLFRGKEKAWKTE